MNAPILLQRSGADDKIQPMKTATLPPKSEAEVWLRILHPDRELSPRTARVILKLSFSASELERARELSAKAREGTLTPDEDRQMDDLERAGAMLSTLKSKARQVLRKPARKK